MRSRAVIFPLACCFSSFFFPPPRRTASKRCSYRESANFIASSFWLNLRSISFLFAISYIFLRLNIATYQHKIEFSLPFHLDFSSISFIMFWACPPEALLFDRARGSGPCGLSDLHSFASFGRAAGSGTPPYPSRFRAPRGDFLFFNNLGLDRLKQGPIIINYRRYQFTTVWVTV